MCAIFLLVRSFSTSKSVVSSNFALECKLVVIGPGRTIFALVWLTGQWSCRSTLMLWWSDSSANTAVLMQLYSSVNMLYVCIVVYVVRSCFVDYHYIRMYGSHDPTNSISHIIEHHKWQRSECGWKCFNLCTNNFDNILLIDLLWLISWCLFGLECL
jgi:hypothetical protein